MNQSSWLDIGADDSVPEVLWEDDGRRFCRIWRSSGDGVRRAYIAVVLVEEHPTPGSVSRLTHEYSLSDCLDAAWALRPLEIRRERGRTVLVLEYQDAEPLQRLIGSPLEMGRFLRLAIALLHVLGQLHERGLIHRDIKPANIVVDVASDRIWLTGFGVASRQPREHLALAPPEFIAGTLSHMAPEQTGRMNRSIDSRSDLYSAGITLYQALTGSLPFIASDPMEWVHCHIARKPVPPRERIEAVPLQVSAIVMKLLAKTPEERYQTAAGVERDLQRCLVALEARGNIDEFPLGEHDRPDRLRIPEKLYGRAHEIEALLASFDDAVAGGRPRLVLVCGRPGIGKSAVVNELHKVMVPQRGLFASGKFDQLNRDIPYATFAQAFQTLVSRLLGKRANELDKWRDELREALTPQGALVLELVPQLKFIIGEQPAVPDVPPLAAKTRLQLAFRRFVSVFARPDHPLVLFLDDLQWVDPASLELLADLLVQPDQQHLLLIGAYRDDEVGGDHPLTRTLAALRQVGTSVHRIVLAALSDEDLAQMVADAFQCEPERAFGLAQLIHEKTGGNPFFANQFIQELVEEGLITFDHGDTRWVWDLPSIRVKGYTSNVVDLMVGKLSRLPLATQKALTALAGLGNLADTSVLAGVLGTSNNGVHSDLSEAVRAGLIVRVEDSYRFLHDRIQEAAYSLIEEEQRAQAHLRAGRLLKTHVAGDKREEAIFEIVGQLNRGSALITSQDEREELARLNLLAGKRAKAAAAWASALKYFSAGAALVAEEGGEERRDLAFDLELCRAECEFLTGELTVGEQRLVRLTPRTANVVQRAAVACLLTDIHFALKRPDRGLAECLDCLRRIGLDIPMTPTRVQAQGAYDDFWARLGARTIEDLAGLPRMTDSASRAILDVLVKMWPAAQSVDKNLVCLVACAAAGLTLDRGNDDGSPLAYAALGWVACKQFDDLDAASRLGRLALGLLEGRGFRRFEAIVRLNVANQCMPLGEHIGKCIDHIRIGIESANKSGDQLYAVAGWSVLVGSMLLAGRPLIEAQEAADTGIDCARRAGMVDMVNSTETLAVFVRNFRGLTGQFGTFDDERFDERRMEDHFATQPHALSYESTYWIRKLQARFFAGDYAAAADASVRAERLLWSVPVLYPLCDYALCTALTHASLYDSATTEDRRQHLEAVVAHLRQLEAWAQQCPQNFQCRAALVAAEVARLEERDHDSARLYELAIRSARENGFVDNEALALELAARFYATRGFDRIARTYMRDARLAYIQWGADGKVRQLEEHYSYLDEDDRRPHPGQTVQTPVERLDLGTVLEVSKAVSGENDLEKLIATVMRLAVEQAGAERGLLILPRGDGYRIEAEARVDNDAVTVDLLQTSLAAGTLPESLFQYTVRTKGRVVLEDATADNQFADDEYLRRRPARSVLCLPLLNQTRLVGVIYLENNLTSGAFTAARMAVLEVLASDAAISIENARLYRDLQERERESRLMVESIPGLVALLGATGNLEVVNHQILDYTGRTLEELKQWETSDLVHAEDLPEVIATFTRSIASGHPYDIVQRLRRFDAVYRWFLNSGFPVRDADGQVTRWCVLLTDIDVQKRAEDAIRASERDLKLIIDTVPAMAWSATPDGRAEFFSQQYLDFLGLSAEMVSDWDWANAVHPDHAHRLADWQRIMASGAPVEGEVRLRRHDGQYRWFLFRLNPLRDQAGAIVKWYGVNTDIEDRKRAEAELTALKDQLYKENLVLRDEVDRTSMFEEIVGTSKSLNAVLSRVSKVAPTDSTVLITGETGTGKELVARAIHRRSARSARPFVSVNCAAVPRELIASELFGHEKGAFTGATQRRLGRFELAHGGTIFLDEVGELPMETQVALLRVLQEREFERVGGTASVRVDVRVIAATNRDLQAAIEAGMIRSDLFYRLNVFPLAVPALRERADDIPLLVEYFIDRFARKAGKTIRRVNMQTLDQLRSYPWPGNVRELQNVVERSVIVCDTDEFRVDESWLTAGSTVVNKAALSDTVAAHEKAVIEDALRASDGQVAGPLGAAARLGIARSTLESKIRVLGINKNRFRKQSTKQ